TRPREDAASRAVPDDDVVLPVLDPAGAAGELHRPPHHDDLAGPVRRCPQGTQGAAGLGAGLQNLGGGRLRARRALLRGTVVAWVVVQTVTPHLSPPRKTGDLYLLSFLGCANRLGLIDISRHRVQGF